MVPKFNNSSFDSQCLFCAIINQTIPSYQIAESETAIVILDAFPASKGHALILSKNHYPNLTMTDDAVLADMVILAKKMSQWFQVVYPEIQGFNYLINQGGVAGQTVFHTHMHIIPKYQSDQGFYFDISRRDETQKELAQIHSELKTKLP